MDDGWMDGCVCGWVDGGRKRRIGKVKKTNPFDCELLSG